MAVTNATPREEIRIDAGQTPWSVRWSLWAGFVAFVFDLGASYVVQYNGCTPAGHLKLHFITLVCLLIALSGFVSGYRLFRRLPHDSKEEGPAPWDRAHFQALLGIALSVAFAVAILASGIPRLLLEPCQ
jgi:hypothetical protein